MIHALEHTIEDGWTLILFLFLTYLGMEFLEHKTGDKTPALVQKAGKFGPVIGALLGVVPQCGFSAAASNLYAGRVITMGTLIAIYLSTSDEMLPVLISSQAPLHTILLILLVKVVVGMVAGFVVDLVIHPKKEDHIHIHEICEHENCDCIQGGIFRSALKHTVQVGLFIFFVSFLLNLGLEFVGEEALAGVLLNRPVLGPMIAGLVGFIPNCAASVVMTELYLGGVLGIGALFAGLLVGAGVGLLVLFRVNHHPRENLQIAVILYLVGVCVGIVAEVLLG